MLWKTGNSSNMSKRMRVCCFALAFLVATAILSTAAHAQVLYGSITGSVTDATNAAVPNVAVTVTNQANGETRTVTTGGSGEYLIRNLEAGPYTVEVKPFANFGGYVQKDFPLTVSQEARVNISLQLASVKSEVTVTTAAAALQTETAEVNHQLSQSMVAELPLTSSQGRNFQALYTLIPGAANVQEQNSVGGNPARGLSLNVNGVEDMSNTTRVDGAVNTYGWLPYLIAYIPPPDAIQTVNVTTSSFNAEQGVAGGASINVIIKSGTNQFHGSVWEYNQLFNINARSYTTTAAAFPRIPKNIFNQYGFSIGGPVYIPKLLKGKDKLFFFQDFDRTTRRQLITTPTTVPDVAMIGGSFAETAGLTGANQAILYDPQPGGVVQTGANTTNGYLNVGFRPTFQSEYGCNCIPTVRQSTAAAKMLALLQPVSAKVGTPSTTLLNSQLLNDYNGAGTFAYNRTASDSKVTYNPSDKTSIFGRYSVQPFSGVDPQEFGGAGGSTFDGGQPGAASGRLQNVGLGASHVITPNLVIDVDGGYTRQKLGAQSTLDLSLGDFGTQVLGIPGTNGIGPDYVGQPAFDFTGFSPLGNSQGANPFIFRDNQFTGDVNLSWTKGKHATKYGFTYYHFDLNHFQPTSGANIQTPRGGFMFQGGMTTGPLNLSNAGVANNINNYTSLADFILGLPNFNGTAQGAVAHPSQIYNPNSLRWTELAGYAQDQWTMTSKLTVNYGVRYEFYPAPYRDRPGVARLDPSLPQTANVEIGGVNGNPKGAGYNGGYGFFAPRLGFAYRMNDKTVIRAGGGLTADPDSMRYLRDSFPEDLAPTYYSSGTDTIAVDTSVPGGNPLPLTTGIPLQTTPTFPSGFASLPVSGSTTTAPSNYRRGYIESWNLFLQRDLGAHFVANIGYVGTHAVRQLFGYNLDAAPLPSGLTTCMANGQYNPTSGATGTCNFNANTIVNQQHCNATSTSLNADGTTSQTGYLCYNTGGITYAQPSQSATYNGLQTQLSRNAGRLAQFGLIYTWSHAIDYEDNGAGSGSEGVKFSSPAYFSLNRGNAGYDRRNNLQFWSIYHLPFGHDQKFASHGFAAAVFGGFQLNGQISHVSGAPFSVSPSSSAINSPGNTEYADLVKPYVQLGGHNRTPGNSSVSGGMAWFDPTAFANPVEPTYTATQSPASIVAPHFGNTHRNEFRGPGVTNVNASIFRGFHIFRESEFQVRVEAFNLLNHVELVSNPNATVGGGTFGYITSFNLSNNPGVTRTLQFSGRINF
jgi:hypothetical protein